MTGLVLLLLAAIAPASAQKTDNSFIRFIYCHDSSHGAYETRCVQLNPDGKGTWRYKLRDETRSTDETELPLTLSAHALSRFTSLLAGTRFLADGAKYESSKKNIGDLGKKRLVVEREAGRREAVFNYSEIKEVRSLAEFLDNLIEEESAISSLEGAQKYQRLAIPERLDRVMNLIDTKRIVDPERAATALDALQADTKILDSARQLARQIRDRLLKMK